MYSVGNLIKARLEALTPLAGWSVRLGTDDGARTAVPMVDVRLAGLSALPSRNTAVSVQPGWQITLGVRRSATAAEQLDAVFAAVIASLHNWAPGQSAGRGWERLQLSGAVDAVFADEGLCGVTLTFTTSALYEGQD